MSFLIGFAINCAISAAILSFIPMVKHKGFGSCFAVAAIMSVLNVLLLSVATIPAMVCAVILAMIPVLGWMLLPFLTLLFAWLINTVSLYLADQAIEDFEIKTLSDTALTAAVLAIGNTVINVVLR